jgi:murein DD-endopeptidase MepM/ murein hydrolase activator NlpD
MFPIKDKYTIGYRHGQKTFYNSAHIGVDLWVPEMTKLYAPDDGMVNTFFGLQGGQWLSLTTSRGVHRFAHLKQYVALTGQVKRGDLIAYSGGQKGQWYSGNSTNPHAHWDILLEGKYIDPLQWSQPETLDQIRSGINQNFRNQFKRDPVKEDNDYFLSRIGQPEPFGINSSFDLIEKLRYWSRQTNEAWLKERKKVLNP